MYFQLNPNSQQTAWTSTSHYYHELENPGYHVPTNVSAAVQYCNHNR